MALLIALDGPDGSGKTTQAPLLRDRLRENGYTVHELSFPDYEDDSSALVRMYLHGGFGPDPRAVNAYAASVFYAADRYASFKRKWEPLYRQPGAVILTCRYTSSNAIHQLSKLPREEWDEFLGWLSDLEFIKLGIPNPDLTLLLDMPPEISADRLSCREHQTGAGPDIHERDMEYIRRSYEAAMYSCEHYGWTKIGCCAGDTSLDRADIHRLIWERVREFLEDRPSE